MVTGIQTVYACLGGLGLAAFVAGVYSLARNVGPRGTGGGTQASVVVPPPAPTGREVGPTTARVKRRSRGAQPQARSAGREES
jgi:hypothetical protein